MQGSSDKTIDQKINISSFLSHFHVMMGPFGLYQHATIREPLLREGYCVDDNARAVQVLVGLLPLVVAKNKAEVKALLTKCWDFIIEAEERPGYYHNFRSSDGMWLKQDQSEDMYARLIRCFVVILASSEVEELHIQAEAMLQRLLNRVDAMQAARFWAEFLVAMTAIPVNRRMNTLALAQKGQAALTKSWQVHASSQWPWFENIMTYANALLPHGVLAGLIINPSKSQTEILHASARFLQDSVILEGMFIPIGSNGWYPKGGMQSKDNQQAIEASTMFDFLLEYHSHFPGKVVLEEIAAPYLWFFGKNTGDVVMVDEKTGASLDGLFAHGPNPNNGAESMLAYQWAEILLHKAPTEVMTYIQEAKKQIKE
ncbi:MAG: hypothetical protein HYZ61_01780 [Candidatus Andersenbacteria bacterium]|nr:hypothetical protein [Candidatus Andersenbacteria bacterium]